MISRLTMDIVNDNSTETVGLRYGYQEPYKLALELYGFNHIDNKAEILFDNFFEDIKCNNKWKIEYSIKEPETILCRLNQAGAAIAQSTRRSFANTVWINPILLNKKQNELLKKFGKNQPYKMHIRKDMPDNCILVTYTQESEDNTGKFRHPYDRAIFKHKNKYYNGHESQYHSWKDYFYVIDVVE